MIVAVEMTRHVILVTFRMKQFVVTLRPAFHVISFEAGLR